MQSVVTWISGLIILAFAAPAVATSDSSSVLLCDVDQNSFIDRVDIDLIKAAKGTFASGPDDPRDVDRNGKIRHRDVRLCIARCDNYNCTPTNTGGPLLCDLEQDGDVDRRDLRALRQRFGTPAEGPDDPADADGNGHINRTDAQLCRRDCTLPRCTIIDPPGNSRPVADAGPDQNVVLGSTAQLDGSGSSDADGDPLSYAWSLKSVPAGSTAQIQNPHTVNANFQPDLAGVYTVKLLVADAHLTSHLDTMTITATSDDVTVPDVIGDPQSDAQNQLAVVGLVTGTLTSMPSAIVPAGSVIDQAPAGGTLVAPGSSVDLLISTGPINQPPVADAGPDQSAPVTTLITLDASGSADADGNPLSYSWALNRPTDSGAVLSDPASVNPSFTLDKAGTYSAVLTVSDGALSATDTVTVSTVNSAPLANAGPDQNAFTGDTITLDGSASSDVDGDPLTWQWQIQTAPVGSTSALVGANTATPGLLVDVPGSWSIQLVVNDSVVNSAPDFVSISTDNTAPIANAGANQTAPVGASVVLDGTGSTDADSDPLTYRWAFTSRPPNSSAALQQPLSPMPEFIVDTAGAYTVQLFVNDGSVDSAPATVTIETTNTAPVADAGPDQTPFTGDLVTLNGTASSDVDGDALSYQWSLTTTPPGSTASLSAPDSAQPDFTIDIAGLYVAQLIVNDGTLDSAPDTVIIDTANSAPVAAAGANQGGQVGDLITLDGSGSSDIDGDALTYSWSLETTPLGSNAQLSNASTPNPAFVLDVAGIYVAQLIVTDGALSSQPDTITISTENTAPVAVIQVTGDPAFVGDTLTFDGSNSTDADNDLLQYAWAVLDAPAGSLSVLSSPASVATTLVLDLSGDYTVQLQVDDGTATSAPLTVTVSTGNSRPIADAGPGSTGFSGDTVTFDGQASSDPDNDALSYSWSLLSKPAMSLATLSDTTTVAPELVTDVAGTYVAQLIVSDGLLQSAPATSMADIEALPLLSIEDQSVVEGDSGNTTASFTVTLSKPISETVTVNYATADLSATAGADYTAASGTLTFAPGDTEQSVDVQILGDTNFEPDEDFELTLTDPDRAVVSVPSAIASISNDDFVGTLSLQLASTSLLTFETVTATLTSSVPAPTGGLVITLDSAASVTLPTRATIAEGATSVSFDVTAGSEAESLTIAANAEGFEDAAASASVTLRNLALALDFPLLGVNEEGSGTVTLVNPAPVAGAAITLSVVDPAIASVAPATVAIAGGDLTGGFTLTGLTAGFSELTASAAGYAPQSLAFESTTKILSVAQAIELPLQRSISYPVTIAPEVAPAGGLLVSLTSSTPEVVITPGLLLIPEGAVAANAQVIANGFTPANIRATAPGFAGDSGSVAAVAELRIPQNSISFTEGFGSSFDIDLLADNSAAVAPAGGLPLALTATDPTCVTVQPTSTLPENLSSISVNVEFAGNATLPCTSSVSVTSLDQVVGDSLNVTVNEAQPIELNRIRDVGKNLQYSGQSAELRLTERFHGGVTVRVESNAPSKLLIARSTTLAGAAVQEFFLADGEDRQFFILQGLNHSDVNQAASVTVSAPGFADATGVLNVVDPALNFQSLPSTLTVFGADRSVIVRPGVPAGNGIEIQAVRVGAQNISVAISSGAPGLVSLVDAAAPVASLTRNIAVGATATSPTFQVRALDIGTATITAAANGFTPAVQSIEAVGPQQSFSIQNAYVGEGLQSVSPGRVFMGATNHGGVTLRITSQDPAVLLLSPDATTAGAASIDIAVPDGQQQAFFTTHGINVGQTTLTSSAPGFLGATTNYQTVPTGLRLLGISPSTDTLDPNDVFSVQLVALRAATIQQNQPLRIGGGAVTATVVSSDPTVATLGLPAQPDAAQQSVTFNPGEREVELALQPVTVGTTTLSATATAAGLTVQAANPVTTTITAPVVDNSLTPATVGAGLQTVPSGNGRPDLRLSAPNHGGVIATLTSSDPAVLRLAADDTSPGTASIEVLFVDGDTRENYAIHGIAPGTATISYSVPGFTTPVDRSVTVVTPDLTLSSLPATVDTLDADVRLSARLASPVRFGGGPLTITAVNSDPGVGILVVDGNAAQSQTLVLAEGATVTPTSGNPPAGGLLFRPLSTGSTQVTLSAVGFNSVTEDTLVTTPSITLEGATVGVGLRTSQSRRITLGAGNHGGITGQLCSTSAAIALVAVTASDPGSACIDFDFTQGQTVKTFHVHGISEGSVNLQMTAPGFLEASSQAEVLPTFVSTSTLPQPVSLAAGERSFSVRVGTIQSNGNLSSLPVNATVGSIPFSVSSSDGAVATLEADGSSNTTLQLQVSAGNSSKAVSFQPLSAGSTIIEASGTGLNQANGAQQSVTVVP